MEFATEMEVEELTKDEENLKKFINKLNQIESIKLLEEKYISYITTNELNIDQLRCLNKFIEYIKGEI